jgi:hypothetical protein
MPAWSRLGASARACLPRRAARAAGGVQRRQGGAHRVARRPADRAVVADEPPNGEPTRPYGIGAIRQVRPLDSTSC